MKQKKTNIPAIKRSSGLFWITVQFIPFILAGIVYPFNQFADIKTTFGKTLFGIFIESFAFIGICVIWRKALETKYSFIKTGLSKSKNTKIIFELSQAEKWKSIKIIDAYRVYFRESRLAESTITLAPAENGILLNIVNEDWRFNYPALLFRIKIIRLIRQMSKTV